MWLLDCDQSDSMARHYQVEPQTVFDELVKIVPKRFMLLDNDDAALSCTFTCTSTMNLWGESVFARVAPVPEGAEIQFRCAGPVQKALHGSPHAVRLLTHMMDELSDRLRTSAGSGT